MFQLGQYGQGERRIESNSIWARPNGGRAAGGYKDKAGDCTCRAIVFATGMPYESVYDLLNDHAQPAESE